MKFRWMEFSVGTAMLASACCAWNRNSSADSLASSDTAGITVQSLENAGTMPVNLPKELKDRCLQVLPQHHWGTNINLCHTDSDGLQSLYNCQRGLVSQCTHACVEGELEAHCAETESSEVRCQALKRGGIQDPIRICSTLDGALIGERAIFNCSLGKVERSCDGLCFGGGSVFCQDAESTKKDFFAHLSDCPALNDQCIEAEGGKQHYCNAYEKLEICPAACASSSDSNDSNRQGGCLAVQPERN